MNKHTNVRCWFMLVWLHKIRYIDITFNNVFENVEVNIIHQKMKIWSSFTHPQVIPDLYGKRKDDILKNVGNQTVAGSY